MTASLTCQAACIHGRNEHLLPGEFSRVVVVGEDVHPHVGVGVLEFELGVIVLNRWHLWGHTLQSFRVHDGCGFVNDDP